MPRCWVLWIIRNPVSHYLVLLLEGWTHTELCIAYKSGYLMLSFGVSQNGVFFLGVFDQNIYSVPKKKPQNCCALCVRGEAGVWKIYLLNLTRKFIWKQDFCCCCCWYGSVKNRYTHFLLAIHVEELRYIWIYLLRLGNTFSFSYFCYLGECDFLFILVDNQENFPIFSNSIFRFKSSTSKKNVFFSLLNFVHNCVWCDEQLRDRERRTDV